MHLFRISLPMPPLEVNLFQIDTKIKQLYAETLTFTTADVFSHYG